MKKIILFLTFFVVSISGTKMELLAQESNTEQKVKTFVNNIGNQTLEIIQDNKRSSAEKETILNKLFVNTVDVAWIGDFVLGRYLHIITPEQLSEYRDLYKRFLINSYVPKFKQYTRENFQITSVTKRNDNEYIVYTLISRPNKQPISVNYMIRVDSSNPDKFKVCDIIAEGASLILTTRADFGSIIANNNNQIEPLLTQLKAKMKEK